MLTISMNALECKREEKTKAKDQKKERKTKEKKNEKKRTKKKNEKKRPRPTQQSVYDQRPFQDPPIPFQ